MKTYTKAMITCFTLLVALSAFTPVVDAGKEKLLIRKWMPEKIVMGEHTKEFDLDDGEERSIEFKKNGKYAKDGEPDSGSWKLSEDGKKLIMEGGEFGSEWTIDELSKCRCTITTGKNGESATLYLIPYKAPVKKKE
ncbi:hypothetical protein [Microscilla marina]|uniref:Lipocalin-like domain-containing protein n=1 Tax=Microscilla marina ATCC 23134 TaxID=313606 RepID=A1ZQG6_MICM2|nr:hypothetical protein [Microscilla marina]EAY27338.1 hypothetical protein M23134_08290 [Microscilla marina ATCC 23134]